MLNAENMSNLFSRLDDLKKVFIYGERLLPVIHSLGVFMKETVPLLENINRSIADSTSKIPKVQNQINSVTSATELATTEILDLVDALNNDLGLIEKSVTEVLIKEKDKKDFLTSLIPFLNKENAEDFIKEFLKKNDCSDRLSETLKLVCNMKNDTNDITISLQVQDITAQQLATVNHLIESVQEKLSGLISDFDKNQIEESVDNTFNIPVNATFNPGARYTKSSIAQQEVDSIFKNSEVETASQEEIDKLFK
jgi:chemotaxis regulatin CheY-phosphate phosphatase CheZ